MEAWDAIRARRNVRVYQGRGAGGFATSLPVVLKCCNHRFG
jgi:hypothetical protein